jgi:hypothetical protein
MQRTAEEDLRDPVRKWVMGRGLCPRDEVPRCGKVPDVIGLSGDNIVLAIEMKVSDWQRALYQATLYTMFANESYIAMPENKRELLLRNIRRFERWDIGILIVNKDNNVCLLRSPKGSTREMGVSDSSKSLSGDFK